MIFANKLSRQEALEIEAKIIKLLQSIPEKEILLDIACQLLNLDVLKLPWGYKIGYYTIYKDTQEFWIVLKG